MFSAHSIKTRANQEPEISNVQNESAAAADPIPANPSSKAQATAEFLDAIATFISSVPAHVANAMLAQASELIKAVNRTTELQMEEAFTSTYLCKDKARTGIILLSSIDGLSPESLSSLIHGVGNQMRKNASVIDYKVLAFLNKQEVHHRFYPTLSHNQVIWVDSPPNFLIEDSFRFDQMSQSDRDAWIETLPKELQSFADYLNPYQNECVVFLDNPERILRMKKVFLKRAEQTYNATRALFANNDCVGKVDQVIRSDLYYSLLIEHDQQRTQLLASLISSPKNVKESYLLQAIFNGDYQTVVKLMVAEEKKIETPYRPLHEFSYLITPLELACMYRQWKIINYLLTTTTERMTPYLSQLLARPPITYYFLDLQFIGCDLSPNFINEIDAFAKMLGFHGILKDNGKRNNHSLAMVFATANSILPALEVMLKGYHIPLSLIQRTKRRIADPLLKEKMKELVKPGDSIVIISDDDDVLPMLASYALQGCRIALFHTNLMSSILRTNPNFFVSMNYNTLPSMEKVNEILDLRKKPWPATGTEESRLQLESMTKAVLRAIIADKEKAEKAAQKAAEKAKQDLKAIKIKATQEKFQELMGAAAASALHGHSSRVFASSAYSSPNQTSFLIRSSASAAAAEPSPQQSMSNAATSKSSNINPNVFFNQAAAAQSSQMIRGQANRPAQLGKDTTSPAKG